MCHSWGLQSSARRSYSVLLWKCSTKSFVCLFVCGVKPHSSSYMKFGYCMSRCVGDCILAFLIEELGWTPARLSHAKYPPKIPLQWWAGFPCCASPHTCSSELKLRLPNSCQQWAENRDSAAPPCPSLPLPSREPQADTN